MAINETHASHIRRVEVRFSITGKNLIPNQITQTIGIQPDHLGHRGDARKNGLGMTLGVHENSFWVLTTGQKIDSKDINDHFQALLSQLLPHKEAILKWAEGGETSFDVLWQSTYLYAGTGPVIDPEWIQGVAQLAAGMAFDIYQIDDEDVSNQ